MENRIKGVDTAHWDDEVHSKSDDIDWKKAAADGVKFAFIKATQGTSYKDKSFAMSVKGARDAGIYVGAYHFFEPAQDGAAQYKHFKAYLDSVDFFGKPYLPHVLDWESMAYNPHQQVEAMAFLNGVDDCTPFIYSYTFFFESAKLKLIEWFTKFPLWIADYRGGKSPGIPKPWKTAKIWQFTEKGRVAGIKGECDVNYFFGTMDELTAMLVYPKGTAPQPVEPKLQEPVVEPTPAPKPTQPPKKVFTWTDLWNSIKSFFGF